MTDRATSAHTPTMIATEIDEARRAAILYQLEHIGDAATSHELYHDDAVLELPQSGERFEGVASFRAWRERYPIPVELRLRRLTGSGDVWVREMSATYDGGPAMFGIGLLEFDGDRVRRERIYVTEPFEAPEWRAQWRSATPAE